MSLLTTERQPNQQWIVVTVNSTGRQELAKRNDKKTWRRKIADDLEVASSKNNMREVYQLKNVLISKSSRKASQIRDAKGEILKDEATRLQRWAAYFEDLLNAEEPSELLDFSRFNPCEELNIDMEPPTREELHKGISLLQRNKAPGIYNIPLIFSRMVATTSKNGC